MTFGTNKGNAYMKYILIILMLFLVACTSQTTDKYIILANGITWNCYLTNATSISTPNFQCPGRLYACVTIHHNGVSFQTLNQMFAAYCDNGDVYLNVTDIKLSNKETTR